MIVGKIDPLIHFFMKETWSYTGEIKQFINAWCRCSSLIILMITYDYVIAHLKNITISYQK